MTIRKYANWILLIALPLCTGVSASTAIADSLLAEPAVGAKTSVSVSPTRSEPTTAGAEAITSPSTPSASTDRVLSANPLWAMPIKQFSATRDRPIFLPSRRPPAPLAPVVTVAKAIVVPKPKEPERPQLSLVGTILGDEDKFGIFIDQVTKAVLRLRLGEDFQGWKLQSVQGGEATFQRNQLSFVVALPQPGLSQAPIAVQIGAPVGAGDGRLLPVNTRQRPER
jgi:hypothetical protein